MSTVFDVPCPDCGLPMSVEADGDVRCSSCQQGYVLRMGHLLSLDRPATGAADPATSTSS